MAGRKVRPPVAAGRVRRVVTEDLHSTQDGLGERLGEASAVVHLGSRRNNLSDKLDGLAALFTARAPPGQAENRAGLPRKAPRCTVDEAPREP
ncbi:hypothetical protein GCM10027174_16550 [Salinifilum aidingensis]